MHAGSARVDHPPLMLISLKSRPEEEQMAEGPGHGSEGRRVSKLLDQQLLQLQEMHLGCRVQGLMFPDSQS